MATLQERINMLAGELSPEEMTPQQTPFKTDTSVTPNTIEENIAAIQKQMDDATTMSPEATQFMNARQELIDDVLMPLSNEGYSDLVNVILTKPRDSVEHNQAKTMLRNVMAQDEDFDMNDFEVMINMVSKEPRPADLINREGLPDAPPRSMGIGSLR